MQAQQLSPAAADLPISLITPYGYAYSSCGYCKSEPKRTRASVTAVSSSFHPSHYQVLVDRGWRRLDALAYDSTKDQRQAVNRWNNYILGQKYVEKAARLCPRTRQEKRLRRIRFDVCESVHEAESRNVKRPFDTRGNESLNPAHEFEVTLEPDNFTDEKYALFANYQAAVHLEKPSQISKDGFRRFLCSGLERSVYLKDGKNRKLGSCHQCYRLDGKLVAMGVLDLLPHCVSSVYLMYHESVNNWNFGKISALQEIAIAREGEYRYYYMGFYIHSCIKMRYKGAFRPTYVLDPESNAWDLMDTEMLQRLSARKYVSMSRERRLRIPATSVSAFLQSDLATGFSFAEELDLGFEKFQSTFDYVEGRSNGAGVEAEEQYSTVFEATMPGVMTLQEVESIDLGLWKLKLGNMSANLEDLVGWDDSDVTDSSTVKGLAAELAACIGPELFKQTIIQFS